MAQAFAVRPRPIPQFPLRFRRREVHLVLRHPQAIDGNKRLLAAELRVKLCAERKRIQRAARQFDGRRLASGQSGDVRKHLLQRQIFAAKNIPLADHTALQRQEMAVRDVVHVHEVQAGIDESGDLAGRRLHDDPPRRRRLYIAWTDRRRWIHDHRWQTIYRDHPLDRALRQHLAALVRADGLMGLGRLRFIDDLARRTHLQRGDAARVHDPLDPLGKRRAHGGLGAFQVGALDLARIARPDAVIGGNVQQVTHAFHGGAHGGFVAHVADHDFGVEAFEVLPGTGLAYDYAYVEAAFPRTPRHTSSHESRYTVD